MNDSLRFNRRQISQLFWETIEGYHFNTLPPDDYFEGLRDQATYYAVAWCRMPAK